MNQGKYIFAHKWTSQPGEYEVYNVSSSGDIKLKKNFNVK